MAQNLREKRKNIARNTIIYSTQLVDALHGLLDLKEERAKLSEDFLDTDFPDSTDLMHLTAGIIGTLFDFVVPSLSANYQDDASGNRNKQILLQIRK